MQGKILYRTSDYKILGYAHNKDVSSLSYVLGQGQAQATIDLPQSLLDDGSPEGWWLEGSIPVKNKHGYIELTCNITDTDGDGVPDMPADGTSSCTFTVTKKDKDGIVMNQASDNETIKLKVTRGKLSAMSVALVNGTAQFSLTSIQETVPIFVYAENDKLGMVNFQIQLTP